MRYAYVEVHNPASIRLGGSTERALTQMSDFNTSDNTAEITDEQALNLVDLVELGATTSTDPENLLFLYNLANEHLDKFLAAAEAAKEAAKSSTSTDPKSIARSRVTGVEASADLIAAIEQVTEILFNVLDSDISQAAPLLANLGSLTKYVSDVRDIEIARVTAEVKAEKGIDPNTPDADEDAEYSKLVFKAARNVLNKLIPVCGIMKAEIPAEIPTKRNSSGDIVPDLRDLPKGRAAGSSSPNAGRGSKARRVRYTWTPVNGETTELREGITLAEIAVLTISQGGYRVLNSELQEMFGKDKIDQFSSEPWSIEFETGTLSGWLPKE